MRPASATAPTAAARPSVRQAAVESLRRDGDRWTLRAGGGDHTADAVVLAVGAPRRAQLLDDVAPAGAAAAGRVVVASSVVVALAVPDTTVLPDHSGVLVATGESLHAKAITLTSRKWGRRGDAELLRLSFGRLGDDVAATASDDDLLAWACADLRAVFGVDVTPLDVHVARWLEAMPQYGPGHAAIAAEIRAGVPDSIAVAGNFLDGIGVPACIASGTAAAAKLARLPVAR